MIASGAKTVLTAGYILAGALSCPVATAPRVTVQLSNDPPQYSSALSVQQLKTFKIDTKFSHGSNEAFVTSGITESNLEANFNVGFQKLESADANEACIRLTDLAVTIAYKPVVYIASEYPANSCRYNTIALHEFKHVNTDIITIKEYIPYIEKYMQQTVTAFPATEPVPASSVEGAKSGMMEKIKTSLNTINDYMQRTRLQRQQAIDTRQEYLRVSRACPAEK